jgi:hypothetical protein
MGAAVDQDQHVSKCYRLLYLSVKDSFQTASATASLAAFIYSLL